LKAELESLGAKVLMTRTADKTVSLTERLNQSRAAKPDLFISIHSDSMPDNVDISQYFGISTFYREAHARLISEEICNYTASVLNRKNRGVKVRNFYVIRGTWTPSMLIECGFVPNPAEFEWLTDEKEQQKLMKTIAEAIVNYFCGNVPIQ
jgi:N-acetylmuramoyl-L-alanine amidase